MSTPQPQPERARGIRDQIKRYRTAFTAVVVMILLAVLIGGYILSKERLTLPGWVPLVGTTSFHLAAEFETAQAVTPGQGQAATIAGVKVGEVESVRLHNGIAIVSMELQPKYARYIYKNATLLLRPKTQLKDETVQIDPGSPSSGRVHEGEVMPLSQTAPDINLYTLLNSLDGETREYLQALLASAGVALHNNGRQLSADFRRFDPLTRDLKKISSQLQLRHVYIERSIHNFQLLLSALGDKDKQLREAIYASNKVFSVFSQEDDALQETLKLLPSTLKKTKSGLGKLTTATDALGPALKRLHGFATSLAPAEEASRAMFKATTPAINNQVSPFMSEILPVLRKVTPSTQSFDEALPKLQSSFGVVNEFFNELAFNPGRGQAGFLFFLDWANHNFNSALSSADAGGPLGRTLLYFSCGLAPILEGAASINPNVHLLVGLLNPPTGKECEENHLPVATGVATPAAVGSQAGRNPLTTRQGKGR